MRFVAADFAVDPIAAGLLEAGLDPRAKCLFLLEGVAVYLEPTTLERVLRQLREVAADGSRLAISVATAGQDPVARARFRAAVAAVGEPVRSTMGLADAGAVLAGAGWGWLAGPGGDPEEQARHERLGSIGLLVAGAASATAIDDCRQYRWLAAGWSPTGYCSRSSACSAGGTDIPAISRPCSRRCTTVSMTFTRAYCLFSAETTCQRDSAGLVRDSISSTALT